MLDCVGATYDKYFFYIWILFLPLFTLETFLFAFKPFFFI